MKLIRNVSSSRLFLDAYSKFKILIFFLSRLDALPTARKSLSIFLLTVQHLFHIYRTQVAVPDVVEAAKDADILIFVIPHQFIKGLGAQMVGKIKPSAIGLSLIKGFDVAEGGGIELISHIITKHLKVSFMEIEGFA